MGDVWIPVTERLPKSISTVIVQVKGIEKPTFGWYGSINGWRLSDKDYEGLTGFSVIAWMPLPDPFVAGVTLSDLFVGDCVEDENIKLVLLYLDMLDSESRQQLSEISIANPDQVVAYATNSVQLRIGKLDNLDKKTEISRSFLSELKVAKRPKEYYRTFRCNNIAYGCRPCR